MTNLEWTQYRNNQNGDVVDAVFVTSDSLKEAQDLFSGVRDGDVLYRNVEGHRTYYTWSNLGYLLNTYTVVEAEDPAEAVEEELTRLGALKRAGALADAHCPQEAQVWLAIADQLRLDDGQ